jgi:hypothetical protein
MELWGRNAVATAILFANGVSQDSQITPKSNKYKARKQSEILLPCFMQTISKYFADEV